LIQLGGVSGRSQWVELMGGAASLVLTQELLEQTFSKDINKHTLKIR